MPIFELTQNQLKPLVETTFEAEGIKERKDLQRLLREQIGVLDEEIMVVAEEFGDWDASRRIDLLCLDPDANLVVVELKRTDDGGHMELQALRYAAMVSAMTFEQLVDTFARYKNKVEPDIEAARSAIMQFLDWDDIYEEQFAQDTRVVLAAADFSKELTTSAMWLIGHGVDIRCVRMKPWRMENGTVLVDVQQLIPLPEVAEFQTQIGVKKQAERQNLASRHERLLKFWEGLLEHAKTKCDVHANSSPTKEMFIQGSAGRGGFHLNYKVRRNDSQVELWIVKNKPAFKALYRRRTQLSSILMGHLSGKT
jgi:hypothetical protein